jgi:RNA polymerase sigma-70 factor (ECF subfamily)
LEERPRSVVELPVAGPSATEIALDELERVYGFLFVRVGNRADAEDLAQQVAMRSIPRLRAGASPASIRAYMFATARTVLASFWSARLGMPEEELPEDVAAGPGDSTGDAESMERANRILAALPQNYRRVLELRFLRGYSLKEVAAEMKLNVGNVKVMQLRALRAAARVGWDV